MKKLTPLFKVMVIFILLLLTTVLILGEPINGINATFIILKIVGFITGFVLYKLTLKWMI